MLLVLSVPNHVDESLPFLLFSLYFLISRVSLGSGHSVEHLRLSPCLLFQCELLPTNYPFTNTLFLTFVLLSCCCCYFSLICFSSIIFPSVHPASLSLTTSTSPSPAPFRSLCLLLLLLLFSLSLFQELKEFSWDQVRISCSFKRVRKC